MRFRIILYLLLVCLSLAGAELCAQTLLPVNSQHYTTEEGLCDNAIADLETDKNGFLWLATRNGLSRFDGLQFTNYYQQPGGLRSNWVTDLETDKQGTLWVATEWGVCWYDALRDRFVYVAPPGTLTVLFKCPLLARDSLLWVAASNGLFRINIHTKKLQSTVLRRLDDPQCIAADDAGNLLIGSRRYGIYQYQPQTNKAHRIALPDFPTGAHHMGMCRKDGFVWVATDTGLLRIDPQLQTRVFNCFQGSTRSEVHQLMTAIPYPLTDSDDLICSSYDKKLYVFNTRKQAFTHRVVSGKGLVPTSDAPYLSAHVSGGKLWLGTGAGLVSIDSAQPEMQLYPLPEKYRGSMVRNAIASADGKDLWLALLGPATLLRYNPVRQTVTASRALTIAEVDNISVHFLRDGDFFWLTYGNVLEQCREQDGSVVRRFTMPFLPVHPCSVPGNRLGMGTGEGIAFVDKTSGKIQTLPIPFRGSTLEQGSDPQPFATTGLWIDTVQNTAWVSSIKYGLFEVQISSGQIRRYPQPVRHAYNARNRIAALEHAPDGSLWLGTMDGLTRFDTKKKLFYNYRAAPRKVPNYVYKTSWDASGNLWCRTNEGMYCRMAGTNRFVFYDLPLEMLDGYLWQQPIPYQNGMALGYKDGLVFIEPRSAVQKGRLPVLVSECKTPDTSFYLYAQESRLAIRYPQNSLNISFTSPVYDRASEIQYEYRMLGRDEKFKPAPPSRQILYTNLPGGDYIFELRGNLEGYVPGMARLHLTVTPPFRETIWFRLLIIAGIAGALYGLYRYRLYQVHREQAFRNKISRNLHDEMGATLSSINIFSEVGKRTAGEKMPQELFEKIFNSSAALQESVSDIIWYINPRMDSLQDVLVRLQDFAIPLLEARGISYKFDTDHDAPIKIPMRYREHLYLIFKEALNNAMKYARPQNIEVSFFKEGENIVCRISDDGQGFDPEAIRRGNGLKNMRERAALMKAKISWETAPGEGCRMTLVFR